MSKIHFLKIVSAKFIFLFYRNKINRIILEFTPLWSQITFSRKMNKSAKNGLDIINVQCIWNKMELKMSTK
jgi:hypothetical protein